MSSTLFRSCLLLCAVVTVTAASKQDKPLPYSVNGEMPRNSDTAVCWKAQAEQVQNSADTPYFTGFFQWHSRSDREYKPFYQWEVRLTSEVACPDLQIRMSSLGPDLQPNLGKEGHWVDLDDLPAKGEKDFSYKLNCPIPSAVRIDLKWRGGTESFLTTNAHDLPQPHSANANRPTLLVLQPSFEYSAKKKTGEITFYLRNDGAKPATEVTHTLLLKDGKGKVVHEHEYVPEKGTIEPGYAKQQTVTIAKCPQFANIAIKTSTAEDRQVAIDPGRFSEARELQIAEFAYADGVVSAKVRNGQQSAVQGLLVQLHLLDGKGNLLREVAIPVGDVAPGETRPISGEAPGIEGVGGWGFGYETGVPVAAPAPAPEQQVQELDVDGIVLRLLGVTAAGDGVALQLAVVNRRSDPCDGLLCTVDLRDGHGGTASVDVPVGDLAHGATWNGEITVAGLRKVAGLGMRWKLGATE